MKSALEVSVIRMVGNRKKGGYYDQFGEEGGGGGGIYLSLPCCRRQNDSYIKTGSDESHILMFH